MKPPLKMDDNGGRWETRDAPATVKWHDTSLSETCLWSPNIAKIANWPKVDEGSQAGDWHLTHFTRYNCIYFC